jgi:hypothetical protein
MERLHPMPNYRRLADCRNDLTDGNRHHSGHCRCAGGNRRPDRLSALAPVRFRRHMLRTFSPTPVQRMAAAAILKSGPAGGRSHQLRLSDQTIGAA